MRVKELFEAGDREKAFTLCSEFLARYPDAVLPHITKALVYFGKQQLVEAEQEVTRALAKRNDWATVWGFLGIIAREQANYQLASECFRKASNFVRSLEERADYLFWLADTNGALKNYSAAVSSLKESYRLNPQFVSAWTLIIMYMLKHQIVFFGFIAASLYSIILLPPTVALAPLLVIVTFLLVTVVYVVSTNRAQQAVFPIVMATILLSIFYLRVK